jgi:hypothetical protein
MSGLLDPHRLASVMRSRNRLVGVRHYGAEAGA